MPDETLASIPDQGRWLPLQEVYVLSEQESSISKGGAADSYAPIETELLSAQTDALRYPGRHHEDNPSADERTY